MSRILVLGASGLLGRHVLDRLVRSQVAVVAGARRPESVQQPDGHHPVPVLHVDYDQPETLRHALSEGVDRLFVLTGGPDGPRHDQTIASLAAESGVRHAVKISALGVHEQGRDPISTWHRAGESAFTRAGLSCSFLRPGALMSNALMWRTSIERDAPIALVAPSLPVACIDPRDIADVAAQLLHHPRPGVTGYPLTGPAAISPAAQVATLARLLDRHVAFQEVTVEQAIHQFIGYGMSGELADAVVATMDSPRRGIGHRTYPTVQEVLGRAPRSFEDWATDHLCAFRPDPHQRGVTKETHDPDH